MRDLAGCLEPCVRCETSAEQQQRFTLQLSDLKQRASTQAVAFRNDGQETHWIKRPPFEAGITGRHDSHFDLAAIKQVSQLSPACIFQLNLNERMPSLIPRKKICQKALDRLGRGADAQQTSMSCSQGSRSLAKRLDFCQQTTAMPQQVLAL
jgi:hypothetical protein